MPAAVPQFDLWSLVYGKPEIDPSRLFAALQQALSSEPRQDFRTKILIRDSLCALERRWGTERLNACLSARAKDAAHRILSEDLGEPGFSSLEARMADATDPTTILQFLREVGERLHVASRLEIGGSSALILRHLLSRATEDIDVVDEVPAAIRVEHDFLNDLTSRYGLRLTHFQSHYLPAGWDRRVESLGRFGKLDVFLVHPIDIFVGKLFSKRAKDRDDLRILLPLLERPLIEDRLRASAVALLADPALRADAEKNWYVLFGDPLPA